MEEITIMEKILVYSSGISTIFFFIILLLGLITERIEVSRTPYEFSYGRLTVIGGWGLFVSLFTFLLSLCGAYAT